MAKQVASMGVPRVVQILQLAMVTVLEGMALPILFLPKVTVLEGMALPILFLARVTVLEGMALPILSPARGTAAVRVVLQTLLPSLAELNHANANGDDNSLSNSSRDWAVSRDGAMVEVESSGFGCTICSCHHIHFIHFV
jgi:hypothetical protein